MTSLLPAETTLSRLRRWANARVRGEGRTVLEDAAVCLYRFSAPATVQKSPTFGVTFVVIIDGSKTVRVNGQDFSATPRQHFVVTREVPISTSVLPGRHAPYLSLSLTFRPELVARALSTLSTADDVSTEGSDEGFEVPFDAPVLAAFERYLDAQEDPFERRVLGPLAMEEIVFRLLRSKAAAAIRSAVGGANDSAQLLESLRFMQSNLGRKHTVATLASQAAMSPSHFAHRFSALVRTSPMKYLRALRLSAAKEQLLLPGARVGVVAQRLGFETQAHFAREFKRRYGESPRQWLASQRAP